MIGRSFAREPLEDRCRQRREQRIAADDRDRRRGRGRVESSQARDRQQRRSYQYRGHAHQRRRHAPEADENGHQQRPDGERCHQDALEDAEHAREHVMRRDADQKRPSPGVEHRLAEPRERQQRERRHGRLEGAQRNERGAPRERRRDQWQADAA